MKRFKKNIRRSLLAFSSVVFLALLAFACRPQDFSDSADVVSVFTSVPDAPVGGGDSFRVGLSLKVARGWHINANVLSGSARGLLTGTEVSFEANPNFEVSGSEYPEGVPYESDFADESLVVYDGTVEARFDLKAYESLGPGSYDLKGKLQVQACNQEFCLGPGEKPVVWSIRVK